MAIKIDSNQILSDLYLTKQKEREVTSLSVEDKISILEIEMGGTWTYSSFDVRDDLNEGDEMELRLAMLEDEYISQKRLAFIC